MTIPEFGTYKNENGETPPSDFTSELAEKYVKYKAFSAVISPAAKLVKGNDVLKGKIKEAIKSVTGEVLEDSTIDIIVTGDLDIWFDKQLKDKGYNKSTTENVDSQQEINSIDLKTLPDFN